MYRERNDRAIPLSRHDKHSSKLKGQNLWKGITRVENKGWSRK
jgi:hypothetical protein